MPLSGGPLSIDEDIRALVATMIPPFATMAPKPEAGTPATGTVDAITRPDHQHPRLTATARGILSSEGLATVVFTQVFDTEPAVAIISVGARTSNKSVPDFDFTFATDAQGKFTGGTVYGRRARKFPDQPLAANPLAGLLGTLVNVVSGLNAIALSITGYDATEPAAGAGFTLIAVKQS